MHELPITQSIINISCEEAIKHNVKKVNKIKIKVGELTGLVPQSIQYYFDIISKGTIIEGAVLDVEKIPIKVKCKECGFEDFLPKDCYTCPKCKSSNIKISGGNEFYIDSMEVE